ncbi:MAG: hypothetical protein M3R01_15015, partial [Actinomycetota bacterium]|nr:hypothetical protein [Actinomycetota bacterium]
MTERPLQIAEELLALPTAPFAEELTLAYVRAFADRTPGVEASADGAGNVTVRTSGEAGAHPLVLVAHLDHPGFTVDGADASTVAMAFAGGLAARAVPVGTPVDLFRRGSPEPVGRASLTSVSERRGRLTGALAEIDHGEAVVGGFATWTFPHLPAGVD